MIVCWGQDWAGGLMATSPLASLLTRPVITLFLVACPESASREVSESGRLDRLLADGLRHELL